MSEEKEGKTIITLEKLSLIMGMFIMVASPVTFLYMHKLDKADFKEYRHEMKNELQDTKKQVNQISENVVWIKATLAEKRRKEK
jgi:hypothetical protein